MPRKLLYCVVTFISVKTFSQTSPSTKGELVENRSGINWSSAKTWEELLEDATKQNKNIFIDCYTTWCTPCQKMDKEVLNQTSVYEPLNNSFVSIRLQIDTNQRDGLTVKQKYALSSFVAKSFNISVFPTYLFISSKGEPLHRIHGAKDQEEFVKEVNKSKIKNYQVYSKIRKFQSGNMEFVEMSDFFYELRDLSFYNLADSVALKFITGYVDCLSDKEFLRKDVLLFLGRNIHYLNSGHRLVALCKNNPRLMDSITGKSQFSNLVINLLIDQEIIKPIKRKSVNEPDWDSICKTIENKFGRSYVSNNVLSAKIGWASLNEKWDLYTKYLTVQVNRQMPIVIDINNIVSWVQLNNNAFKVFQYSLDSVELKSALQWTEIILKADPNNFYVMDTKANLLYKLGHLESAIELEAKAFSYATNKNPIDEGAIQELKETLRKMKSGVPTWGEN